MEVSLFYDSTRGQPYTVYGWTEKPERNVIMRRTPSECFRHPTSDSRAKDGGGV